MLLLKKRAYSAVRNRHNNPDSAVFTTSTAIVNRRWYDKFLPKSMRKTSQITLDNATNKILEEEVFKGNVPIKRNVFNASGDIEYESTFDPKTKTEEVKKLVEGRYLKSKSVDNVLRYEEKLGGFTDLKEFEPTGTLLNVDFPKDSVMQIYYDASGKIQKQECLKSFKDGAGKVKDYVYIRKSGNNTTIFNPDGTVKSEILYKKELNEYRSWDKNPYFEEWTHTDPNGEKLGVVVNYNDSLCYYYKKTSTKEGYKEYVIDTRRLKAKYTNYVNNDGTRKCKTEYFDSTVIERSEAKNGSFSEEIRHKDGTTDYKECSSNGQTIHSRKYNPQTNITTEINYKKGNTKQTRSLKDGILLEELHENKFTNEKLFHYKFDESTKTWKSFTKHYNSNTNTNYYEFSRGKEGGKSETRFFDKDYQRINPDGTKYKYNSQEEHSNEWFKQKDNAGENNSNGGKTGGSNGKDKTNNGNNSNNDKTNDSGGKDKTNEESKTDGKNTNKTKPKRPESSIGNEKEFIDNLDSFLTSKKHKLNIKEYEYLAKILGVDNVELLKDIANTKNKEAKKLYRKLCTKYHPDKNGDDKIFKIIQNLHTLRK